MIRSVKVRNWKSHHETSLEFSDGVNALIGTMGSGKSSVLEAIVFGLYGTTPALNSREITLDDVIRRNPSPADQAEVKVGLEIDGENYTVKRVIEREKGTKKSELRKDGELIEAPSTQEVTEQVEKRLGMDFDSFTRAIYSEQNDLDLFMEMRPGKRKEKIDELLKLDRFEDARQTVVSVENQLGKDQEKRQEELAELEEELDEEELEELEDDIEEKKEEREELQEKVEELQEELAELEEEKEDLEEKKDRAEKLGERLTKLETRKETVDERLEELGDVEAENAREKLESAREELEEIENQENRLGKIQDRLELRNERMEELEEEIEELEEEVEKFQELEEVEEELEELGEKIEDVKERGNRMHAERQSIIEDVKKIRGADECPTCGQELDPRHREEFMEDNRERVEELKEKEKKLREELEELEEEKKELDEKRDELMQYQDSGEELEELREKREELEEEVEELEEEREELEEELEEKDTEELEERIEELEEVEKIEELKEKREHLEEKIEETEEEKDGLEFDPERLEALREKHADLKEERSVKENTLESLEELVEEKEKRLEQLQKQFEKREELEKKVENLDHLRDYVHDYRIALEETQVALRERFVERLNELMDSIWERVYPYDDYYSIRLNGEEGYLLELLDSDNNWINAEAEVSGGERHSAALVMRLALTFALSPKIQVLMLDEPTHNLDSSAVEELAETLRERTSDLIDQLFVVTHDPALEAAATGRLYQFEKKGTETGLTEVEEVK